LEEIMLAQTLESVPRFISTLAAPIAPQDELARIPLALTGRWVRGTREFAITRQDLESILKNFRGRQNGEINVDYDHASEMPEVAAGGPIPSAGRIVNMDAPEALQESSSDARFILYGWYEPTDRARRLIANREYRYISPAIDWSARSKKNGKPLGATLSTVALTNRPFLEEMPPIHLSDPEFRLVNEALALHQPADPTDTAVEDDRNPPRRAGGFMKTVRLSVVDGNVKITHDNQEFFADPADVKACAKALASEAAPQAQESTEEIPLVRASAFLSEADAEGKSISALELFRGEVDRELENAVRTGKILPRRRDDWRKIALADLPAFRRIVADQKPQVPLRPVGFSGAAPQGGSQVQVKLLAEQRMRERGISFGQALSEISREQPELAREYRRAVSSTE
jgi:Mu-like prophage I protein